MAGTREGNLKGARKKREQGFDFAAAGSAGGKNRVKKGLAKVSEKKKKQITRKGGIARHKKQ